MKRIFKYAVDGFGKETELHSGARILKVGQQNGQVMIWAWIDDCNPLESRKFLLIATGQPFDDSGVRYLDTVQMDNGLVWHVMEVLRGQTTQQKIRTWTLSRGECVEIPAGGWDEEIKVVALDDVKKLLGALENINAAAYNQYHALELARLAKRALEPWQSVIE